MRVRLGGHNTQATPLHGIISPVFVLVNACQDFTRELSVEVITALCESAPSIFREGGGGIVGAVVPLTINTLARHPEGTVPDCQQSLCCLDCLSGLVAASTASTWAVMSLSGSWALFSFPQGISCSDAPPPA